MGGASDNFANVAHRWWNGGSSVGLHHCDHWLLVRVPEHRGNGKHGTHLGRYAERDFELEAPADQIPGQYHWVSEFAPKPAQKFLSYIVGWLCFTGWQCAITSITFLAGTIIQGLIVLSNPDTYVAQPWQGTLLIIAITCFAIFFNTVLSKKLPLVEGLLLVLHVLGAFAIIITLWVLAPTADAKTVWTEFTNAGAWNSDGTATMVGLLSTIISMIGFDCVVHMSEEVKDAGSTLPKALLWSVAFNAALGFLMAVTLCFCLGDVTSILSTATGYPFIQVFYNVTHSYAGASVMTSILILTLTSAAIAEVATASRQLWSFARGMMIFNLVETTIG